MDLVCYAYPGWDPRIRPASSKRLWMDETPESFAYRCLPLAIANAHGWEIMSPCGFEARWTGGSGAEAVEVRLDPGTELRMAPVSLFGQATVTFHIEGLFRTPPGWNLWVGGSPNHAKDGIAPLGGVIETDWSPYTFTMNWRFTRQDHWVRFEKDEPICFFFPVERNALLETEPQVRPIDEAPELKEQFERWSASRNAFQEQVRIDRPQAPADKWQKLYYRGVDPDGVKRIEGHQSKLRLAPFATGGDSVSCPVRPEAAPESVAPPSPADPAVELALRKREWMLDVMHRQRALSPKTRSIVRNYWMSGQDFLDQHYAPGWPAILAGEMEDWPALRLWTRDYLRQRVGAAEVEFQGGRNSDPAFELYKDAPKQVMPFDRYLDLIGGDGGNDAYITAYNSDRNYEAFAPLEADLGFPDKFLDREAAHHNGMMWVGPMGTFTPMHHDLTNNLIAQVQGSKRIILVPPSETKRLYNDCYVFSKVGDLMNFDPVKFPLAQDIQHYEVELQAGEMLYIPIGWWHQVTSLDFSITITYTNFLWPNDAHATYPFE